MEELNLRAANYAEGKANEAMTKAISQAYVEGYQAGYKDGKDEVPVNIPKEDVGAKFIDLGLTSGTLWAEDYEMENGKIHYLPYQEAYKYHLPTEEQFKELGNECRFIYDNYSNGELKSCTCIGPNGNTIIFQCTGTLVGDKKEDTYAAIFWLKDDINKLVKKNVDIRHNYKRVDASFSGYKLAIRQIK